MLSQQLNISMRLLLRFVLVAIVTARFVPQENGIQGLMELAGGEGCSASAAIPGICPDGSEICSW
jgi:hypothetical protein